MSNNKIRFGSFELDVKAGELTRGGRRVRLQDKPLNMLLVLVAQPGEVVSRDELRARLWPLNIVVDFDNGLNNAANKLRAVLGDSANAPRYIETVGRRGYRFIGALEKSAAPARDPADEIASGPPVLAAPLAAEATSAPPSASAAPRRVLRVAAAAAVAVVLIAAAVVVLRDRQSSSSGIPPIESLAVLPLANLSSDPEQEYFSDGMTDALIGELASMGSLRIISRQSIMRLQRQRFADARDRSRAQRRRHRRRHGASVGESRARLGAARFMHRPTGTYGRRNTIGRSGTCSRCRRKSRKRSPASSARP